MGKIRNTHILGNANLPSLLFKQTHVIQTKKELPVSTALILEKGNNIKHAIFTNYIRTITLDSKSSYNTQIKVHEQCRNNSYIAECNSHSEQKDNSNNSNHSNRDIDPKLDKEYIKRKANLGTMVQMLQLKVPQLLTKTIPKEFVTSDIILKILPHQFPNLPIIKSYVVYKSTLKTIQKILLLFYLNPDSKIHITNTKIIEPTNSMSSDELINLSINQNKIEAEPLDLSNQQDTSGYTTKIKIKWRTCYSGCDHLQDKNTRDARLGSYSLDHFNWTKFLKSPESMQFEAKKTLEELAKTLDPLSNNEKSSNVGRVLHGVFVFELDANNERITVFTIDNMEILESEEMNYSNGVFAA